MNNRIPCPLRLLAASFYFVGAIPSTIIILYLTLTTLSITQAFQPIAFLPNNIMLLLRDYSLQNLTASGLLTPLLNWMLWRTTKNLHPFVDQAGRDGLNYTLNAVLGILTSLIFCVFAFFMTCAPGANIQLIFALGPTLFFAYCVTISYFTNSIVAGMFALFGFRFHSPLIHFFV